MDRTYTKEQIWAAVNKTWATAPEAAIIGDQVMPVTPSDEEQEEIKQYFFERLDIEAGYLSEEDSEFE